MTPQEIHEQVRAVWDNSLPDKRLAQLQNLAKTIPPTDLPFFDAICDAVRSGVRDDETAIVVVLVHGIRTDGAWHQLVRQRLKGLPKVNVLSVGYGYFGTMRFLGPLRARPIRTVAGEIRDIRDQEPKAKLIVVAHSFGTYIISKILRANPKLRFTRIIFCGSVVPADYEWDVIANDLTAADVVNDVGTGDFLPIVAQCVTWGYGCAGRLGFQKNRVTNRFFNYSHSGFFTPTHIDTFWKPFIESGVIVDSPWTLARPTTPWVWNVLGGARGVGKAVFWLIILPVLGLIIFSAGRWLLS